MLSKREKILVSIAAVFVLGTLAYHIYDRLMPIGPRLKNPETRASMLSKLIKRNHIKKKDLPKHFRYTDKDDIIQYFTKKDRDGSEYHLVVVRINIEMLSDRIYSFVFDSDGKCILRSKDQPRFDNGSMADYTHDGYIEKIIVYNTALRDDDSIDTSIDYDGLMQIWRLQRPSPKLLLEVRFKNFVTDKNDKNGGYSIKVSSDRGRGIELIIPEQDFRTIVSFSWSQEKTSLFAADL